ncbi:MAG: hypothetical protein HEEMFOPI_00436 [Holosporales bacterium]
MPLDPRFSGKKSKETLKGRLILFFRSAFFKVFISIFLLFGFNSVFKRMFKQDPINAVKVSSEAFLIDFVRTPIQAMNNLLDSIKSYQNLLSQNAHLKERVACLENVLLEKNNLIEDLNNVKKIMDQNDFEENQKILRVLGTENIFPNAYMFLKTDSAFSPINNQLILSENRLIGRITSYTSKYIKIMLITDCKSRVPVRLKKSGEQALLIGRGTNDLSVQFIDRTPDDEFINSLSEEDIFVTSGIDDVFSPNIPVARFLGAKNGEVLASPLCNFNTLQFASVLTLQ